MVLDTKAPSPAAKFDVIAPPPYEPRSAVVPVNVAFVLVNTVPHEGVLVPLDINACPAVPAEV